MTGVLVYDRGRFFQWLEGPEASLTSVMQRIRSDLRHVEIAIQVHQEIPGRLLPQWAMNLVAREGESLPEIEGLVTAQPGTLDQLHLNDRRVPIVLASLSVAAWEAGKPAPGG